MIKRQDISAFVRELRPKEGPVTDEMLNKAVRELLDWFAANYDQMDEEAKAHVDWSFNALFQLAGQGLAVRSDSPETRKLRRIQKAGLGEHIHMEPLLRQLEAAPANLSELAQEAERELLAALQTCADFLLDIRERSASVPRVICIGLLYGCLDEYLAALHLARHHYYVQANAHLRTVMEILDKVHLFSEQPQWVDVWTGDDFKRKQKELDPGPVRMKLGKNSYDQLYGHLSEHGTHATYRSIQARTYVSEPESKAGRPVATIFIGGSPAEHLQVWFYLFATLIASRLVNRVTVFGEKELNADEAVQRMEEHASRFLNMAQTRFIPWAASHDLDTSEMQQFIETLPFFRKGNETPDVPPEG